MNTNRHESKQRNLRSQFVTSSVEVSLQQLDVILSEAKNLSRSGRTKKVAGVCWVNAPQSSLTRAPAVQGVMLAPYEDAQWTWTHTTNGCYVSGYTIVPRVTPRPVVLSGAKNLSRFRRRKNSDA
jgi:hypothetical protein